MSALRPLTDEEKVKYADVIATQQKAYQDAKAGNAWGTTVAGPGYSGPGIDEIMKKNPIQTIQQQLNIPQISQMSQEEKGVMGSIVILLAVIGFFGWLVG